MFDCGASYVTYFERFLVGRYKKTICNVGFCTPRIIKSVRSHIVHNEEVYINDGESWCNDLKTRRYLGLFE